jgi:hypothetical protein
MQITTIGFAGGLKEMPLTENGSVEKVIPACLARLYFV